MIGCRRVAELYDRASDRQPSDRLERPQGRLSGLALETRHSLVVNRRSWVLQINCGPAPLLNKENRAHPHPS